MSKRIAFAPLAAAVGLGFSLLVSRLVAPASAHAEGEIRIAEQFGIVYLLLNVVRDQQLIEKHGKQEGIDIKVDWTQLSGGAAGNPAHDWKNAMNQFAVLYGDRFIRPTW
ncbi:hypothetical protein [Pseudomonas sp. RL_105y_Pfl2_101]|uniref:hypothetical protein n=1 Tax=unclassified Pseudomonas TaxID=196821 RepID=UPI00403FADEF